MPGTRSPRMPPELLTMSMVPDAAPTAVRTTAMFCKPFKATLREAMSAFSGKHSNAYTLPRAPTQCAMSTEKYPWCAPTSATTSPGSAARASHASSARSGLYKRVSTKRPYHSCPSVVPM